MEEYRCNICEENWKNCEGCGNSNLPRYGNLMLIEQILEAAARLKLIKSYHTISDLIRSLEND